LKKPEKTKQLLQQALGMNSQQRTVLLEQIDDATLRSQLETLLADEDQRQQFLQQKPEQAPAELQAGDKIKRIRIEQLLGQGGMGSVYLGFDEKLQRQVAVKSIRSDHLKNPATQQRFEREAQILSKINHPFICQLYDYIETDEGDFLVLEYIKGQPLYLTPMTEAQKLQVLHDLATALSVAHEHGIVHRDLKPDNIMITEQGQLKVLDFGIAQSLSQPKSRKNEQPKELDPNLTQQGSLVGTIRYMSPEQAQGKVIQTASDMYAFGIIAQEIFTHQAAYQVLETNQLLEDVQQGKRKANQLPPAIAQLIDQVTQLAPEQRLTAQQAIEYIKAIQQAPIRKRRQRIKYSVVAALLILLMVLFWQWQQFDNQAETGMLIKDYENQINDLVKQSEQIYVLPIHPVNDEISSLLQQAQSLFGQIQNDAQLSDIDKKRLQGIIMLEAEYYQQAVTLLEQGQAESKLLADAWIKLFVQKATEFSDQYGVDQTFQSQQLRTDYLQPALDYIAKTKQETQKQDDLHEAFVLSQTASLESALTKVDEILTQQHWNRDAVELKSLVISAMMAKAREQGEWALAKTYAENTAKTYELSTQMARSYPYDYSNLCHVYLGLATDAIQRTGQAINEYLEKGKQACQNSLVTVPQNSYPMNLMSILYMMEAHWQINSGQDATATIDQAKNWNQQSTALEENIYTQWNQALLLATEAKQMILNGVDALATLNEVMDRFNELLKQDTRSRPAMISDVLAVMSYLAHEQVRRGQPHQPTIEHAHQLFEQAMLTPNLMISERRGLIINMAEVMKIDLQLAYQLGSDQVTEKANALIQFLDPNDNLIKEDPLQLINLAHAHFILAKELYRQQKPFNQHLQLAAKFTAQAQQIISNHFQTELLAAGIISFQNLLNGQAEQLDDAMFQKAMALNPNHPYGYQAWAESLLLRIQQSTAKEQRDTLIDKALSKIDMALTIDPDHPDFIKLKNKLIGLKTTQPKPLL
jgi:serine/threonine protein kinase